MPHPKSEIAQLKAENKKLKGLLKNAVRLLQQSKALLAQSAKAAAPKGPQRTAGKKRGKTAAGSRPARR